VKSLQKIRKLIFYSLIFCAFSNLWANTISFKANSMKGNIGENNTSTVLQGNAWIESNEIILFADEISLSGENYDFIKASGNVKGTYKTSNFSFSCKSLEYNQNTGIIILKENVNLEDIENEVTATASIIEYDKNIEVATMQIDVKINHKESVCTGTLAIYKKAEQMLDLSGSPQIVRGSDTFTAQEITLNMETEEITLDGKVRGSVTEKKETTSQTEE